MSDWMPDFLKLLEMRMQLNAQKNTNNKGPGPNVSGGDVVGGCLHVVGLLFAIFIAIGMFQQALETSRPLWWLESLSLNFYQYLLFWPSKLVYATMTVRDSHYLWPVFIIFVYIILSLYWILLVGLYIKLCDFLGSFVSVFILRCILFGPLIILALGVVYNILLFIGLSYIKWLESIEGG